MHQQNSRNISTIPRIKQLSLGFATPIQTVYITILPNRVFKGERGKMALNNLIISNNYITTFNIIILLL